LKSLQVRKLGPGRKRFGRTTSALDLKDSQSESILETIGDRIHSMSQNFAQVVEDVKQLSFAEKEELHEILKQYLIQERRREIVENYQTSLEEMKNGHLVSFTDPDELCDSLSND